MKRIILTGGGTAGHVTPNLALVPALKEKGYEILYIGSINGMEKQMAEDLGLRYAGISTGKLRRYFDVKNFTDPFRVIKGFFDAGKCIKEFKPDVIFSKGGFVAVPVTVAAWFRRVPVISHESDLTPGLANKIAAPFAKKICCNFPETLEFLPKGKGVLSGTPIRAEILEGDRERGLNKLKFDSKKPVLLVIGGSLGAEHINRTVREALGIFLQDFDVIHICGKGHFDENLENRPGYRQFEFVSDDLKDYFAAADVFISRAGANAICELLALKKPSLLIPLPKGQSRGDQILNAESFERQGYSMVLRDEDLTAESLVKSLYELWNRRESYVRAMENSPVRDAVGVITGEIEKAAGRRDS